MIFNYIILIYIKMNAMRKRFLLFLLGCIPARLALAWVAKELPLLYLSYLGWLALVVACGFIYLFITGKRATGLETGGQPIWWKHLRIVHGLLYLWFAYLAIKRVKTAYKILLADTCIGLLFFIMHHYREGNFSKL